MNGRDLLEGMSYIDDRFVAEAETAGMRKERRFRTRWASLAACLCVAAGILWIGWGRFTPKSGSAADMMMQETVNAGQDVTFAPGGLDPDSIGGSSDSVEKASDRIVWVESQPTVRSDMEIHIPEDALQTVYTNAQAFTLLGGELLPDQLLDRLELLETDHPVWEYPDGTPVDYLLTVRFRYGDDLWVTASPTDLTTLPLGDSWAYMEGCIVYPVDETSISTLNGTDVYFFETPRTEEKTERFAKLIVSVPGTEHNVLLTLSSDTLTRSELEQAAAEVLDFGR